MSRSKLDQLLEDSFVKYEVLFHDLQFHNHNAHHLVSLHLLGATDEQLENAYKNMCADLVPHDPSPEPINLGNYRKFLGNKHFCQSYRDFFAEQLKSNENQWQKRLLELLVDHPQQPMINSVVSGLGHPLIHVGYAFESENILVGIEALTLTAVCYNYLHEKIDQLKPPTSPSKSVMTIFKEIHSDKRLPVYQQPGVSNLEETVKNCHDLVLSYYNQWKIDGNIEELFDFTVYLFAATHIPDKIDFDFFLLHLLTSMNAIRIIDPHLQDRAVFEHVLYQFFYFSIIVYISQLRPEINEHLIDDYQIKADQNDWKYVIDRTLNTKIIDETHAVKVVRALRDAERVYGKKNNFYLKTAVKMVNNLNLDDPWIVGTDDERQLNVLKR